MPNRLPGFTYQRAEATWRSGYATVCKTVYPGSIPGVASSGFEVRRLVSGETPFAIGRPFVIGETGALAGPLLPGSSAVEQPAVNRLVDGSNPSRGAKLNQRLIPKISQAFSTKIRHRATPRATTCKRSRNVTKRPQKSAAHRSWRVSLIRKHGQVLGFVDAPDRASVEAAAVNAFNLDDEQRSRLVVQERG